jgi:hypothetical protein
MLGMALLLSGCSSSGNKADSKDPTQPSSPFGMFQKKPDTKKDLPANSSATSSAPTGKPSGVLAGQVMDRNNRRPAGVIIQVVDLQKNTPDGKFDITADSQGYFTINNLQPGRNYQLVARVKDGDKFYSGTILATPPNPRVSIFVKEEIGTFPPAQNPNDKTAGAEPNAPAALDKPKSAESAQDGNAPASTTSLPNADKIPEPPVL